jgi:Tol biopolymer transport system component
MKQTMKKMVWLMAFLVVGSIQVFGKPFAEGPYLGQTPPGSMAQVFAPGLICHTGTGPQQWEAHGSFSADGNTFCFQRVSGIFIAENTNEGWTAPELITSIPANMWSPWSPCLSPDANSIFFTRALLKPLSKRNIYRCDRTAHGWTAPQTLGPALSSGAKELTCSIAANNSIYFGSTRKGEKPWGRSVIWAAPFVNNTWPRATHISLDNQQVGAPGDPGIAPDESFMVFTAINLPGGYGHRDIYLTLQQPDGTWSKPENLGPRINSSYIEHGPRISPDKKYLFFTRSNGWDPRIDSVESDIYWVELKEYLPESYR